MLTLLLSPITRWVAVGLVILALLGLFKYERQKAQVAQDKAMVAQKTAEVEVAKRKAAEQITGLTDDQLAQYYRSGVLPPSHRRTSP